MTLVPRVRLTVYPDDCDSYGHVNQAAYLRLFERARWEAMAAGPGMLGIFGKAGPVAPVVRSTAFDYSASAYPGDRLEFSSNLTQLGRTSFALYQIARRLQDGAVVAVGEFTFVCVDSHGQPAPLPDAVSDFFGTRPAGRGWTTRRRSVGAVSLALEERGDGPAIVFIHGFPFDRTMWRDQMASLTAWRRIAPDLRGFGLSDAPEQGYSMAAYARDLEALLEALDVTRVVVCGLSMGGYVAFELVRRFPERVRALILSNTRAEPDSEEARKGRGATIGLVQTRGLDALADAMMPKLLAAPTLAGDPKVPAHIRTMIRDNDAGGMVGALSAMRERPDSTPLLGSLGVPVLVLAGSDDQLAPPESAHAMARAIPGASYRLLEDTAHVPPVEQPKATSAAIREFLATLGDG